jgi:hypothetical protein
MRVGISLRAAGWATSLFIGITYALCVGFDVLFPQQAMYAVAPTRCSDSMTRL